MTTDSDNSQHEAQELLLAQLAHLEAQLDTTAERTAFVTSLTASLTGAERIASSALDPRGALAASTNVLLLAWGSTKTKSPALAGALVEAARAYAAVWGFQADIAHALKELETL